MNDSSEKRRGIYGFWIIIAGLIMLLAVFVLAIRTWSDVKDVTAAIGAVSSTIGTLVGAFFGVQAGASGKEKSDAQREKADSERQQAQAQVVRLAALLPPETAARALNIS